MRLIPLKIFENRELISAFVGRELKLRYKGSLLGFAWSLLTPVFLISLYTLIFAGVLKLRLNASSNILDFAFYICYGMVPWLAFADSISRSTTAILENSSLVKKTVFPAEILPINIVIANFLHSMLFLFILILVNLSIKHQLSVFAPLVIIVIIPQILMTIGISWFVSTLVTYISDLRQIVPLLLTAWMFITPIFYPDNIIPGQFKIIAELNPMYAIVKGYRCFLFDGTFLGIKQLIVLYLISLALYGLGYIYMSRSKTCLAELV